MIGQTYYQVQVGNNEKGWMKYEDSAMKEAAIATASRLYQTYKPIKVRVVIVTPTVEEIWNSEQQPSDLRGKG